MTNRVIDRLNTHLQIFKPFSDHYRVLIGDKEKNKIEPVININDYNTGSIANVLMWLEDLRQFLLDQFNLDKAEKHYLENLSKFFAVEKYVGEVDDAYRERVKKVLIHSKESIPSLEQILKDYCEDVRIVDGITDGMFDDVSFDDFYERNVYVFYEYDINVIVEGDGTLLEEDNEGNLMPIVTLPIVINDPYFDIDENNDLTPKEITENYKIIKQAKDSAGIHGQPYYFKVFIKNPMLKHLRTIVYLLDMSKVSGTYYDIYIE